MFDRWCICIDISLLSLYPVILYYSLPYLRREDKPHHRVVDSKSRHGPVIFQVSPNFNPAQPINLAEAELYRHHFGIAQFTSKNRLPNDQQTTNRCPKFAKMAHLDTTIEGYYHSALEACAQASELESSRRLTDALTEYRRSIALIEEMRLQDRPGRPIDEAYFSGVDDVEGVCKVHIAKLEGEL